MTIEIEGSSMPLNVSVRLSVQLFLILVVAFAMPGCQSQLGTAVEADARIAGSVGSRSLRTTF